MRGDPHWMRRALALAQGRAGDTWPNPTVGCVIVRDGQVLAEGAHRAAGGPHAEVEAITAARGASLAGATLYVTLEPCHHQGRTPPCTSAIVAAGVKRVVYAVADDNPTVPGGGGAWLAAQGVEVRAGLGEAVAREINHPFFETGGGSECHVTVKLALSADHRLARRDGPVEDPDARRISGERAHRRAHQLRARASCVLVGRRTAAWDRPRLDVRHVAATRSPRPVVLDASLSLPLEPLPAGCLVFAGPDASPGAVGEREASGREVVLVGRDDQGRLRWGEILEALAARRLGQVLVEGGGRVAASLLAANRVHRLHLFLAPVLAGGDAEPLAVTGIESRFTTLRSHRLGEDLEWVLRRREEA